MASTTPTILLIGSLNMDLVTNTPRMPVAGETLLADTYGFHTGPGGKGANQAVAIARLGGDKVKCAMIGMVGDDVFGGEMRGQLEREGIDVSGVGIEKGVSSGVAAILIEHTGENRILVSPGANFVLTPSRIELVSPLPDLLVLQQEIPLDTVAHAIKLYSDPSSKTLVLLNPAPAFSESVTAAAGIDLRNVDFFVPNETEAAITIGSESPVETISQAKEVAQTLLVGKGVRKAVIITMGGQGVVVAYYEDDAAAAEAGKIRIEHVPAMKVKAIDTTGAGDTFIGGFSVNLVAGCGILKSVQRGIEAAAWTVQRKGTQKGIPHRRETDWDSLQ
ncbi:Ribokinase-like protein [Peziza echinospora]|nr:Ribokinase-like protein [Peziza echinospora]